ncbi:sodium/proline symporter PutP [Pseudalkalibacillus decolorationis]|uniref:sodium/proline symporter PutP n=1 Tax=Pseudalkalibacillus decolorationis TaxID=163879 RepID=UPI0021491600|nr:sodium/proline symporter PutP [Pseudalkalibacillus decolorationis]
MSDATILLVTLAIYLLGMIVIGIACYKTTNTMSDYVLGGRRLNSWTTALSAQASDTSGWIVMGLPGAAYATGMHAIWLAVGLAIGAYCNWQFIARRLRVYTEAAKDSITIPEFLENRFHDNSHILRIISALIILVFFTVYVASGLVASGKLFEFMFGIDYQIAVLIGAFVVITYTFLGGYLAVSYTDVVQALIILVALIVVPIVIVSQVGGIGAIWNKMGNINPDLLDATKTVGYNFEDGVFWETSTEGLGIIGIISLFAWGLGYLGQPHILVRYMGMRSAREVPEARFVAIVWNNITQWGALFVGFAAIVFFTEPLADPENAYINMVGILFNPWVAGFMLAAVLAAMMSTVDSQLLVASSALVEDFYRVLFRKEASEKELVWLGRVGVLVISLIALALSYSGGSVLSIVGYAWAGFGAALGPAMLLSLYWKRTTRTGVLWGMIVGAVTVFVWKNYIGLGLYEIIPGFVLSLLTIYVVSILKKEPDQSIQDEFDEVIAKTKSY